MKKEYEQPELEIVEIEEDILTSSDTGWLPWI